MLTLNLSLNVVQDSNDETYFLHKLLLTDTQVSRPCKTFLYGSLINMEVQSPLLPKMIQKRN